MVHAAEKKGTTTTGCMGLWHSTSLQQELPQELLPLLHFLPSSHGVLELSVNVSLSSSSEALAGSIASVHQCYEEGVHTSGKCLSSFLEACETFSSPVPPSPPHLLVLLIGLVTRSLKLLRLLSSIVLFTSSVGWLSGMTVEDSEDSEGWDCI